MRRLVRIATVLGVMLCLGTAAAQPDTRVAVIAPSGSDALDSIQESVNGQVFTSWWDAAAADAVTPFSVVMFDPATLDDAALRWAWRAFERGAIFTGVGARYAEMRYVTGGLCTARGAVLPINLPDSHAITFFVIPGTEAAVTETDLRGCVLSPDGGPYSVPVRSEGILTAPLDANGIDALLETIQAAIE